jgi:beta-galactosidase
VKADNSVDINVIPSQKSDFNIMGGIPRNVWLKVVPAVHLDDFHIIIPQVTNDIAKTNISAIVTNSSNVTEKFALAVKITAPNGAIVAEGNQQKEIVIGENTIAVNLPDIKKPLLWSPDHPNLYTVEVQLKKGKDIIDKLTGRCGYRWYEFKEKGAFYLNGERLLLRGTHRHEERSGYANAIPDSLHRKDIELIKELGANFVRLAHYPQAPEVYRACDELGLLVWDEVPWCRGGMGTAQWQANVKRLFTEQINQHFNHPSIILWSIGNESDWLPDFPDGDNVDSLKAFTKQMHDLAKSLDPYRLTSTRKFEEAAGNVDVFSPSMWPGWYSTVYKEYDKVLATNREKYKRMIHIEYGGDSHVGRHTENPITGEGVIPKDDGQEKSNQVKVKNIANEGDWSESYIVNLLIGI